MPNLSSPVASTSPAVQAIVPADAEPDVTWGRGGIDDWGWTAVKHADSADPPSRDEP